MQFQIVPLTPNDAGKRLDQYLAQKLGHSRQFIQKLIKAGHVRINKNPTKAHHRLEAKEDLAYRIPPAQETGLKAETLPLSILYEDEELLVIDKAAGMVVHPNDTGHREGTVVNAVLAHCPNIQGVGGRKRPGIVHRLDKDTAGVLLIAKTDSMHQHLSALFKKRRIKKTYLALVKGIPKTKKGRIEAPLQRHSKDRKRMAVNPQGKAAFTSFEVQEIYAQLGPQNEKYSLLKVKIETGRTHQIRVHLASIGHPIIGDPVYGEKNLNEYFKEKYGVTHQILQAQELAFEGRRFISRQNAIPHPIQLKAKA